MWRTAPTLAVLLAASLLHAQDASPMVGQRVVIKYKTPLRFGAVIVQQKDYRAYKVEREEGDFYFLAAGGVSGWVHKDDVVPLDRAVAFYTQEIEKDPLSWNAYLYRGFVWDVKHDYDKAIADYTEAIKIYPMWPNTFNNRGWSWHHKKQYDKAIADYTEAIRIDPRCVLAISNRGLAWQDKREYYKALNDYSRAVRIDPKYARGYLARAWLFATCPDKRFRDGKLAVESATRACDLSGWREPDKLAVLAAAYAESGDFDNAVRWQEKAIGRYIEAEDRRIGQERLRLYKAKKPFRMTEEPLPDRQPPDAARDDSADARRWSGMDDPELARRVFAELRDRIGKTPDVNDPRDRTASEKKVTREVEYVARKYHLKQREVQAIWRAGNAASPSERSDLP